jgi:hypothetical protein
MKERMAELTLSTIISDMVLGGSVVCFVLYNSKRSFMNQHHIWH